MQEPLDAQQSGIYKITCLKTGKVYIGLALDVYARRRNHVLNLKNRRHVNKVLQADVDKFGIESFGFEVLEIIDAIALKEREEFWINQYDASICYNKARPTEMKNMSQLQYKMYSLKTESEALKFRIEKLEKELLRLESDLQLSMMQND